VLQGLIKVAGKQPCRCGLQFTVLELGLGGCDAPMLPTTCYYALGWVLCSINKLLCLE